MSPRRFSLCTLLLTIAGLTSVASFNLLIDPFGQYGTALFAPIVQTSRKSKIDLLEKLELPPEGLILGSSRVLKIEPQYLASKTGYRFFNAGVNHGRPADYLALVRWYADRYRKYPKLVLIGVDTAGLHAAVPLDARLVNEPRLAAVVPELITWKDRLDRFSEAIGFKQTRASLTSLKQWLTKKDTSLPIEYYEADGKIVYRQREEERQHGTYDFDGALEYNQREFTTLFRSYGSLSLNEVRHLAETIHLLRQHGTKVFLFKTPYHPELEATLKTQANFTPREAETQQLLTILARHAGCAVVDLTHLDSFQGTPDQFVDGIHPLEDNTRRMIDRILQETGDQQYALQ